MLFDVSETTHRMRAEDESKAETQLSAIWNELMSLKEVVEEEHDRKLRRIESDLRWTMSLVGAQFVTLIGAAIAMLAEG